MGLRGSNWKSKYVKQRTKDAKNPALQAYKYVCAAGHIRIEKDKLIDSVPCQACEREGKSNIFKFVGRYTLPRSQARKSRFE